jgi:hypothetical protein
MGIDCLHERRVVMKCEMTVKQVNERRHKLAADIEAKVRAFLDETKLEDWQVSVSYGPVRISTSVDSGPGIGHTVRMVMVSVSL